MSEAIGALEFLVELAYGCGGKDDLDIESLAYTVRSALEPQWQDISTAPRDGELEVLTWDGIGVNVSIWQGGSYWQSCGMPFTTPTHWMPLPSPPSEVQE